jgi:hypothetical protein
MWGALRQKQLDFLDAFEEEHLPPALNNSPTPGLLGEREINFIC